MLNDQEQKVMDALVAAWNAFCELPSEHGDDVWEFRHGMHALQEKILSRPTRRDYNERAKS